jgi:hypothetical protein
VGWCVGKVVAFRSGQVIRRLNYLVEKIKLGARAQPNPSIGSEDLKQTST